MPRTGAPTRNVAAPRPRARRGYFECRWGQLHVHHAMPPGGGFEEGTPLLCLHDLPGSAWTFARFATLAAEDRSVFAPDVPGCGESDPPPPGVTIAEYAAALGDFLDGMHFKQVDVLGFRSGSSLVVEVALARPTQVRRVVLVSVPLLTHAERKAVPCTPAPAAPDSPFRSVDGPRWAADAAARYPLRERLGKLTQRLLVLRPRDDLSEPTGRVCDVLPAARLSDVDVAGVELFGAAPARAVQAVREFLPG